MKIIVFVVLIVVIGFGLFYWFALRPSEINKACYQEVYSKKLNVSALGEKAVEDYTKILKDSFDTCLHKRGL